MSGQATARDIELLFQTEGFWAREGKREVAPRQPSPPEAAAPGGVEVSQSPWDSIRPESASSQAKYELKKQEGGGLTEGSDAYIFSRGKLTPLEGEHRDTVGPIGEAVDKGMVRIRDHGHTVAFQGRSKAVVDAAVRAFLDQVRVPPKVSVEWPGRYIDNYLGGEDPNIRYSLRTKPAPEKTVVAYKVLRTVATKPGKLFPMYANRTQEVPVGVWLDAEMGKTAMAPRPGWHVADLPRTSQIGKKGPGGEIDRQHAHTVWAEVEIAADVDWQAEADRRGKPKKDGTIDPKTKEIRDEVPVDGFYRYKTKTEMEGEWMISGAMKVNRILEDSEVDQILRDHGVTPVPREGGPIDLAKRGLKYSLERPPGYLANPGLDQPTRDTVEDVDRARAEAGQPAVRPDKEVFAEAERRLTADYEAELANLARKGRAGIQLDDVEIVMGKRIITREHQKAIRDPKRMADVVGLMEGYRDSGSEQGRAMRQRRDLMEYPAERIARILEKELLTPPKKEREERDKARREGDHEKADKINADWAKEIIRIKELAKKYGVDLDALFKAGFSFEKAIKAVRVLHHIKATGWDKAYEYWANAILSAPTTQVANFAGTVYAGWTLTAERLVEATVNLGMRRPEGAQFGEFKHMLAGIMPGITRGARNFAKAWSTEIPALELELGREAAKKIEEEHTAIAGAKGRIVRTPWRLLGAVDDFMKSLFIEMEVGARAYRIAKAEGLSGLKMQKRMTDLQANPHSAAWEQAYFSAKELTFQQEGGPVAKKIKEGALALRRAVPGVRYLIPFVSTPVNLFELAVKKSPLGITEAIYHAYDNYRSGRSVLDGMSSRTAQQIISWAIMLALMSNDEEEPWITGSEKALSAAGREECSGPIRR